jgi:hypothetical protein
MGALAAFHLGLIVPWSAGLVEAPAWLAGVERAPSGAALIVLAFCCLELLGCSSAGAVLARNRWRGAPSAQRQQSAFYSGGIAVAAMATPAAATNIWWIGIERFLSHSYGYELFAMTDSRLLQMGLFWLLPAGALIAFVAPDRASRPRPCCRSRRWWSSSSCGPGSQRRDVLPRRAAVVWTYRRGPCRAGGVPAVFFAGLMPMVAVRQLPRRDVSSPRSERRRGGVAGGIEQMGNSVRLVETLRRVPASSVSARPVLRQALRRVVPTSACRRHRTTGTTGVDAAEPLDHPSSRRGRTRHSAVSLPPWPSRI